MNRSMPTTPARQDPPAHEPKVPAGGPADADHEPTDDANTSEGRYDPAVEADEKARERGEK
jgi:hypothetical protein